MKAVISNVNIQPIEMYFQGEDHYVGGFNSFPSELLTPSSRLAMEPVQSLLVYIDSSAFFGDRLYALPSAKTESELLRELEVFLSFLVKHRKANPKSVIALTSFVLPPRSVISYLESHSGSNSFSNLEFALNSRLKEFAGAHPGILLIDWVNVVRFHGYSKVYSHLFWYQGRVPLSGFGLELLKSEFDQIVRVYRNAPKKVLVLDLDNTLWGGVVGEDGVNGILLSEEGEGRCFRDLQKAILGLKNLGVLLCVNSKNNAADVAEVFSHHPMMVLREKDFALISANWNSKVENLIEISRKLGLGLDAFVFIDDSPFERESVQKALPQVSVPTPPIERSELLSWFLDSIVYPFFSRTSLSAEDLNKTEQYAANKKRADLALDYSPDQYIRELNIKLRANVNSKKFVSRAAQMTQKTNQFNMTTRRYSENEIEEMMVSPKYLVLTLGYEDRMGQEGTTGLALVELLKEKARIDTFLLSCRIIGRSVEYSLLMEVLRQLELREVKTVEAHFVPTPKNTLGKDFYRSVGWNEVSTNYFSEGLVSLKKKLEAKAGLIACEYHD
jgi:FkbH-like protein